MPLRANLCHFRTKKILCAKACLLLTNAPPDLLLNYLHRSVLFKNFKKVVGHGNHIAPLRDEQLVLLAQRIGHPCDQALTSLLSSHQILVWVGQIASCTRSKNRWECLAPVECAKSEENAGDPKGMDGSPAEARTGTRGEVPCSAVLMIGGRLCGAVKNQDRRRSRPSLPGSVQRFSERSAVWASDRDKARTSRCALSHRWPWQNPSHQPAECIPEAS